MGTSLSCENTIAQAFIFWVGAFETSAVTMQFALYEMSLNYEIQEKAREEVRRVLAKFNGKLTYESLSELEYLGRIIDGEYSFVVIFCFISKYVKKNFFLINTGRR